MTRLLLSSLAVGAGGFAGSVARYMVAVALQRHATLFPAGTLLVNVLGCFVIGLLAQFAASASLLSPTLRLALAVGFCGGFTTVSSLMYETTQFLRSGEYAHAGLYLSVTVFGSLAAVYAGMLLARILARTAGGPWN